MGEIVRGCVDQKKSSFLGSPRDIFRRPSAAPEPIAPKFLHTTFCSKYFLLAEFHRPRLTFGGVMLPTPSGASLHYGLPYTIWQGITRNLGITNKSHVTTVKSCHLRILWWFYVRRKKVNISITLALHEAALTEKWCWALQAWKLICLYVAIFHYLKIINL